MPSENKSRLQSILSMLPSVDAVLQDVEDAEPFEAAPRKLRVRAVRRALDGVRAEYREAEKAGTLESMPRPDDIDYISRAAAELMELRRPSVEPVINATGIILHTNLGRALLSERAVEALTRAAAGYASLEMDISRGRRNHRDIHVEDALIELTGAEAATVVNNDAGAVLIGLNTLAQDREVIVSRGQLVEIGGSFRVPEVMAASGAKMVEVGTTNHTHLYDYERAVNENTALLLKVHTSNYKIVGFTSSVELADMVELARRHGLSVMEDLGSGALVDVRGLGLSDERTVQESVAAGADVVCFSGDKLLGGPQAGIIVGRRDIIKRIRKNPLARALRPDKLVFAALEATLAEYLEGTALDNLPAYRMLTAPLEQLEARAKKALAALGQTPGLRLSVEKDFSQMGSGSLPGQEFPTWVLAVTPSDMSVDRAAQALRDRHPPVVGRISRESLLLDLRTVLPHQDPMLVKALSELGSGS